MRTSSILATFALVSGALLAPSSRGGEIETGFAALDAFTSSGHLDAQEHVLGLVGFYGDPSPPQWLVLTTQAGEDEVLRESVVSGGEVRAERRFRRLPKQDLPSVPMERERLEFDSDAAFDAAEEAAWERKVSFDSAHYQLRCRDLRLEPVWMVSLINSSQVSVGVVYLSAETGEVLRQSWRESSTDTLSSAEPPARKPR